MSSLIDSDMETLVEKIREDFPILKRKINGKSLVYLDNAATSQKPRQVIEMITKVYEQHNANVHRGVHTLSMESTELQEQAREKIAKFFNARYQEEIIFVRNATEALNLVAQSWGRNNIKKGDIILITLMEHHSNIVPWQLLARETGATLKYVQITEDGRLNLDHLKELLSEGNVKILNVTQMSNVLGTINPIKEITRLAHENGALVNVDGAQSAPHMPVDLQNLDCDFFSVSGHKMLAPTGIGVLYAKRELLEEMPPFLGGGDMIKEVHLDGASWNELPWKFEAGTPNYVGAAAFGVAVEYLSKIGMETVRNHEEKIIKYTIERCLEEFNDIIHIYGPLDPQIRGGVFSFNLGDIHAHDLGTILDEMGIAIRTGHHCAQPLITHLGIPAASRASFYIYNTLGEVDTFIEGLKQAKNIFGL